MGSGKPSHVVSVSNNAQTHCVSKRSRVVSLVTSLRRRTVKRLVTSTRQMGRLVTVTQVSRIATQQHLLYQTRGEKVVLQVPVKRNGING
jgi:hypothetical protein